MSWYEILLPIAASSFVLAVTPWVLRYARRTELLALPSARSSHVRPTPQGGGLGIAVAFLLVVLADATVGDRVTDLHVALLGGGGLVALTGWFDDRRTLNSYLRLLLYGLAAAWAVGWLGGMPSLRFGASVLWLRGAGFLMAWLLIVFLTNIYNFMDGIDGIAGLEGVTTCLIAGALAFLTGDRQLASLAFSLGGASLGFLVWNWPPAKIFMGDVGSNFLGYSIAVLAISSEERGGPSLMTWIVLLGVFVVDGAATLARRLCMRKSPRVAHRTHAYQGAVQKGYSHARVALAVLCLNICLGAVAAIGSRLPVAGLALGLGAFLVLLALHWHYSPLRH